MTHDIGHSGSHLGTGTYSGITVSPGSLEFKSRKTGLTPNKTLLLQTPAYRLGEHIVLERWSQQLTEFPILRSWNKRKLTATFKDRQVFLQVIARFYRCHFCGISKQLSPGSPFPLRALCISSTGVRLLSWASLQYKRGRLFARFFFQQGEWELYPEVSCMLNISGVSGR